MKHYYPRIVLLTLLSIVFVNYNSLANKSKVTRIKPIFTFAPVKDDSNLKVTLVIKDNQTDAHVSFNGNEGSKGIVKIFNSKNQLINQFEIGLVHSPEFSVINLNEYSKGIYSFELSTGSGVHISHLTID